MKKLMVTGHVGRDPEIRYAPDGSKFATFSFACDTYSKDDKTEWIEVNCGEKNERNFNLINDHVKKGIRLLLIGNNKIGVYVHPKDGPTATETLYLSELEFQSPKKDNEKSHTVASDVGNNATTNSESASNVNNSNEAANSIPSDEIPI